jgi:sensor histidine kinase YesM
VSRGTRTLGRTLWNTVWQTPLWAVPFALFFGTLFGGNWSVYKGSFLVSLIFAFTIRLALIGLEFVVLRRLRRDPARPPRPRLALEIPLYLVTSVLASFLAAYIVQRTIFPGFLSSPRSFAVTGMYALLFSTLIGGIAYAFHFYRESIARARAVEAIRAELAQAELRALRAQVQPHFLFNTLNSIASLIPTDPAAAEEMTTRLAEVFRHALSASERETTPLGEELAFALSYLDIERARFGGRLRVETDVAPGLDAVPVPSLLLQPVVENAVRYAISPRPDGGTIRLSARREGGALVLVVQDDGPGIPPDVAQRALGQGGDARPAGGRGFGLYSLRERLRASGLVNALAIDSPKGGGARVTITLPSPQP